MIDKNKLKILALMSGEVGDMAKELFEAYTTIKQLHRALDSASYKLAIMDIRNKEYEEILIDTKKYL